MTAARTPIRHPAAHPRFAVIIPAYNHGSRVRSVVEQAKDLGFPVIVVNDGSTDETPRVLDGMDGIHRLDHGCNRGKGAALLAGMRLAATFADYAVTLDADGQHDPADALHLMAAIPDRRRVIVIGRREMADAPWTSRNGRAFSNFWVRLSGGPTLADTQSGFRIYPLPETIDLEVDARRYQFEVEVLVKACWQGIPVLEATISANYGATLPRISHFRPLIDFLRNTGVFSRLITHRIFTPGLWRIRQRSA